MSFSCFELRYRESALDHSTLPECSWWFSYPLSDHWLWLHGWNASLGLTLTGSSTRLSGNSKKLNYIPFCPKFMCLQIPWKVETSQTLLNMVRNSFNDNQNLRVISIFVNIDFQAAYFSRWPKIVTRPLKVWLNFQELRKNVRSNHIHTEGTKISS